MILLTPLESDTPCLEKGMFISSEMAKVISEQLKTGALNFNTPLVPVHLPYEEMCKKDFGRYEGLRIDFESWGNLHLPSQYNGENLNGKKMIVFPMHALGDQLYLAVALRYLASVYPGLEISIVKPSIQSADQWYDYIYFDGFFTITGPVIFTQNMAGYDYYVDVEHFAHIKSFEGTYPPEFYTRIFFKHDVRAVACMKPEIGFVGTSRSGNKSFDELLSVLRLRNKPVVFVNSVTNGRVRDIPRDSVLEFIAGSEQDFSFIISSFNNDDLAQAVKKMNLQHVRMTDDIVHGIDDLIYLIANVDYAVTSDSGITHLAEAVGTPCGSVFNVVTPEERTGPYQFSEELMVDFEIPGVCKTPCYVHCLYSSETCPGMTWKNESEHREVFRRYAPCMENFKGEYLLMLLEELTCKFPEPLERLNGMKQRDIRITDIKTL